MSKITGNESQVCKKSIKERCEFLLTSQKWTDCSFEVGQEPNTETFRVHRLILGISSPVLEAMVLGELAEGQESFSLPDIQPETFRLLLQYIYFDRFELSDLNMAFDLCKVAKEYKLPDLVKQCSGVIQANMSPSTACKTLEFAKLIGELDLIECSMKIISHKTEEVLTDSSIVDISLDTWHSILDCEALEVRNECMLLTALHDWAMKECQRKKLSATKENMWLTVESVISKIRFLNLPLFEFARAPEVPCLLPPEVSNAIFFNKMCEKSPYPMPVGYSMDKEGRCRFRYTCDIVNGEGKVSKNLRDQGNQSVLNVSVNRPIRIYGIVMVGENNGNLTWSDLLDVQVHDNNNFLAWLKLGSSADKKICSKYANKFLFSKPVEIEPKQNYKIIIKFLLKGAITSFCDRPNAKTCEGVTFTLSEDEETIRIVKSILFSHRKG